MTDRERHIIQALGFLHAAIGKLSAHSVAGPQVMASLAAAAKMIELAGHEPKPAPEPKGKRG